MIEYIQKNFITYNLKIKGNTPYPILVIEASLPPIEWIAMIRYVAYKNKINNMDDKRLPKIASNLAKPTSISSGDGIKMPNLG
jgi:hypothetical protein